MKRDSKDIDKRKLVLYLLDEISEPGRFEVDIWLDESQENRDEYESLKKTWEETGELNFPRKIEVNNVWDKFSEKLEVDVKKQELSSKEIANRKLLRYFYGAAAVMFFAWVSVTTVRLIQNDGFKSVELLASNEEVLLDTLQDGSSILINENSTLKIAKRFNKDERVVELDGEAFFEVKPDASKPFIVETGIGQIKVLGTSFQVKGFKESDLEVFVEEGKVELSGLDKSGEGNTIILKAGDRGIIKYPSGELQVGESLLPDDLFWANKKLIFEETKLSLVFELLKKHYGVEIEVENKGINSCLLNAIFNNEKIDQIIAVIAVSFELTSEKNNGKFILKGKGCDNE